LTEPDILYIMSISTHASLVGTVYGVILNDKEELRSLNQSFSEKPYSAPPKAPVLYVKPRNTFAREGARVLMPDGIVQVQVDATLGIVINRDSKRISLEQAHEVIAGFVIASDLSIPHSSYYRPAISQRCRDGFLPMSELLQTDPTFNMASALISTRVNGVVVHSRTLASLFRSVPQLICDVTEFMTLKQHDVLLIGLPFKAPLVFAGDEVSIEVQGLGKLSHQLVASV
jgi:5-oxopent-3-ene-1,2,5-tricarboxylate decarboxylase / 2-hydroxyhepta-2,4-diene-1,7-dioate isomerase